MKQREAGLVRKAEQHRAERTLPNLVCTIDRLPMTAKQLDAFEADTASSLERALLTCNMHDLADVKEVMLGVLTEMHEKHVPAADITVEPTRDRIEPTRPGVDIGEVEWTGGTTQVPVDDLDDLLQYTDHLADEPPPHSDRADELNTVHDLRVTAEQSAELSKHGPLDVPEDEQRPKGWVQPGFVALFKRDENTDD